MPLPQIKIVRHARARKMRLRVYPHEIRLTIPTLCSQKQINLFLAQSHQWLEETWNNIGKIAEIPDVLNVFNNRFEVKIVEQKKCVELKNDILYLNKKQPYQALQRFVLMYAKTHLPEILKQISKVVGVGYQNVQVRYAKTRWGSCSQHQKIMLNALLVLLPRQVIEYVCVHELVHTIYFDHSAMFWQKVSELHASTSSDRQYLKNFVYPQWFYQK